MAPVIGRRWRPICGFAEPYASVRGRDPGNPAGESSPFLTSTPEGGAVRLCGIQAVAVGTICRVHLRLRRLPPVNAQAEPSERAQRRTPESTPILRHRGCRDSSRYFILRRRGVIPMEMTSLWLVSGGGFRGALSPGGAP